MGRVFGFLEVNSVQKNEKYIRISKFLKFLDFWILCRWDPLTIRVKETKKYHIYNSVSTFTSDPPHDPCRQCSGGGERVLAQHK